MKNRIAVAGSILLLASPVAAQAADLIIEEPAALVASNAIDWSGAYVGVHGGFGSGEYQAAAFTDEGTDIDGGLLGVQAGYNVQIDNFVLGIEADASWANIDYGVSAPEGTFNYSVDWLATLRARAGVTFDSVLYYATAGLAAGGAALDMHASPIDYSDSWTHVGWTAGVGAEAMLTDSISINGEYLYRDLGEQYYVLPLPPSADISLKAHTVTVGVNFHF